MRKITSLENLGFSDLYIAFNKAFQDYEIQFNKNDLKVLLQRRGFVPELSFGAFEGDKLIAFTFNGIGFYNGVKTAYDTGTGTIKEYRGQGLATKIFEYSLPFLKKANVSQYLLEVLQHNTKAVSVYKKIGFEVSREFNYFICKNEELQINPSSKNKDFEIIKIGLNQCISMIDFWDFIPAWQNSFDSITRKPDDFIIVGATIRNQVVGYCIFDPKSGDITQIAVNKKHRRKGIASLLLEDVLRYNQHSSVKAINTEVGCKSINDFLQSVGISITGKLFEMIKQLVPLQNFLAKDNTDQ